MEIFIRRLAIASAVLFMTLALALGYWQVIRAPELVRRDDNPRLVLAEQAIARGAIFDRNGIPLALTQPQQGMLRRYYPEPQAGPLIGYYSLRYGVAWAEAAFDARLRGLEGKSTQELEWDALLHRVQRGQSVTLTIDINWQRAAYAALGNRRGALVAADLDSGQILAMASAPTFDPNTLDADWDRLKADAAAPLFNRAVQGQYQPGSLFQTIVLESALRVGAVQMTATTPTQETSVNINGITLGCASPHLLPAESRALTWQDAYAAGCPAPFARLADEINLAALQESVRRWRLDEPLSIGLAGNRAMATAQPSDESDKENIVIGQGPLTFTPLHALYILMAVANDGRLVPLTANKVGVDLSAQTQPLRVQDVAALRAGWERRCNLNGLRGLAASGSGYSGWYMGTTPEDVAAYGVVVLIEDARDGAEAANVACQFVSAIERACEPGRTCSHSVTVP